MIGDPDDAITTPLSLALMKIQYCLPPTFLVLTYPGPAK